MLNKNSKSPKYIFKEYLFEKMGLINYMNKFNKCKQSLNPGDLTSSDEFSKCTKAQCVFIKKVNY